jgi:hypothetical protein
MMVIRFVMAGLYGLRTVCQPHRLTTTTLPPEFQGKPASNDKKSSRVVQVPAGVPPSVCVLTAWATPGKPAAADSPEK